MVGPEHPPRVGQRRAEIVGLLLELFQRRVHVQGTPDIRVASDAAFGDVRIELVQGRQGSGVACLGLGNGLGERLQPHHPHGPSVLQGRSFGRSQGLDVLVTESLELAAEFSLSGPGVLLHAAGSGGAEAFVAVFGSAEVEDLVGVDVGAFESSHGLSQALELAAGLDPADGGHGAVDLRLRPAQDQHVVVVVFDLQPIGADAILFSDLLQFLELTIAVLAVELAEGPGDFVGVDAVGQ